MCGLFSIPEKMVRSDSERYFKFRANLARKLARILKFRAFFQISCKLELKLGTNFEITKNPPDECFTRGIYF